MATNDNTYADNTLDNYLNVTWYNTLSTAMKNAIVDKTFTQDSWYENSSGSPVYTGRYGSKKPGSTNYTLSLANSAYRSAITRHVYALSIQDVLDYVLDTSITDGKLDNYNIWEMYWETDQAVPSVLTTYYPWLRTAYANDSSRSFFIYGPEGLISSAWATSSYSVRPSFTIDLSKIEWTAE